MRDLDKALSDILTIRSQLAAGSAFCGYGPRTVAATGVLSFAAAGAQSVWSGDAPIAPLPYFTLWIVVALLSATLIGAEMIARTRRAHSGLADEMLYAAAERLVPAGAVGGMLLVTFAWFAPDALWTLPGLWPVLVGLGVFASLSALPKPVAIGGAFYVVAGFVVLALAAETRALSPWAMGLSFGLGQLLMAVLLHVSRSADDVA